MTDHAILSLFLAGSTLFSACLKEGRSVTPGAEGGTVRLVVNVDDVGNFPDTADGVVALWKAGAISSASVIAFAPDFDHSVRLLLENGIPTGAHLALNHGNGVLGADEVPSLHAGDGELWGTAEETLANMNIEEVELEFEAQIEKLMKAGIVPSHLDSHMGLVFSDPSLLRLYEALALKYRIPLALPDHPYFDPVRKALASASLPASDALVGIYELPSGVEESGHNRASAYASLLSSLKGGLNHLYSHPTPPTEAVRAAFDDHAIRNDDFSLFMSPEWKELLSASKVTLARY